MSRSAMCVITALLTLCLALAGCGSSGGNGEASQPSAPDVEVEIEPVEETSNQEPVDAGNGEEVTLLIAAAASLEYSYRDELIPLFQERYPNIKVEGTYDSSGKLQTQIQEGLAADIFMSAATKQMDNLKEKDLVVEDSIVNLLENRIVLIAPAGSDNAATDFASIGKAESIALGDPESVPVGDYAKSALTNLGIYDDIADRVSLGTNVTEVLNWVAEGSADVGIVYATDAATTDRVEILAEAPEDSLEEKVIYPVGIVSSSDKRDAAALFIEFLCSDEALAIFEAYGFTPNI